MGDRRRLSTVSRSLPVLFVLAVLPGVASAHEITGSRFTAPLPLSLLFVGAGGTVAVTALWLAFTGDSKAPRDRRRRVLTIPASVGAPARDGIRAVFLASVVATLVLGFTARQVATDNVATVFTWPVWFRGVALLAIVVGSPWQTLSPWRTVYRGLVRLEGEAISVLGTVPAVLSYWPAVAGFVVVIGIVENLTVVPRSPRMTAAIVGAYALVMVGGAVLYGDGWFRRCDPLGVFYRLFARVASVDVSRTDDGAYAVAVRPPWQGCLDPVGSTSLVVFVVATVYTVSFDGFTNTRRFQRLLFWLRDALGTGAGTSVLLYVAGLCVFVATFVAAVWLVEWLGATSRRRWLAATRWFAPTVVPIAAAYEVAHNYPYVLRGLGRLIEVVVRPIVPAVGPIDPLSWLSLPAFWGSQVALVVVGHVVAVVAAHYVAVDRYGSVSEARRAHAPLVVLMIGYTVLSLWIISRPVVA